MIPNIWDQALDLRVLSTFGLVLACFIPMLYSIWRTYEENDESVGTRRHE